VPLQGGELLGGVVRGTRHFSPQVSLFGFVYQIWQNNFKSLFGF
jgi:hypothetical protein